MSMLDIIVLLVLAITMVRGLMRGMVDTLFRWRADPRLLCSRTETSLGQQISAF